MAITSNKSGWRISELKGLNHLHGRLVVRGLEHVKSKEEAEQTYLKHKVHVEELELHWGAEEEETKLSSGQQQNAVDSQENGSSPIWPKSKQFVAAKQMTKGGKYMKKEGLPWAGAAAASALKRCAIKPHFFHATREGRDQRRQKEGARKKGQWRQPTEEEALGWVSWRKKAATEQRRRERVQAPLSSGNFAKAHRSEFLHCRKSTVQVFCTMEGHRSGLLHCGRVTIQVPFTVEDHRPGFPSLWKATVQVPFIVEGHRSGFLHCGRVTIQVSFTIGVHRSGFLHHGRSPFRFPSLWKGHRSGSLHCGRPPFRFSSPWEPTVQVFFHHEIPPFRVTTFSGLGT
ncbi:hypothetical protein Taro_029019 [Colocasia esculenta]|uniref:R13L1/DRL21-like LRR repeat region domain-containing protein n=1 Tax=Colocasia esculenta TaxID=4460 RepID=A0A843VTK5_COLES|nr:hypothetical protein [Colocasia esculenta]